MLHTDNIEIGGISFIHNYSDNGFMIEREDGERFSDAKDLATENHTYVETDVPIEPESEQTETEQKADALDYLIGGDTSE